MLSWRFLGLAHSPRSPRGQKVSEACCRPRTSTFSQAMSQKDDGSAGATVREGATRTWLGRCVETRRSTIDDDACSIGQQGAAIRPDDAIYAGGIDGRGSGAAEHLEQTAFHVLRWMSLPHRTKRQYQ